MAERRTYGSYNDGCAAAHALDLIGDRWTMIVVRELLLGPKRFGELQRDIPGIGPTALTRRLSELVEHGLAERRRAGGSSRAEAYELTPWGYGLEAVNTALAAWAVASPTLPWDADMSPDTLILTMRAHARPCAPTDDPATVLLHLVDSRREDAEPVSYLVRTGAGGTTIERAPEPAQADADVTATTRALKAVVLGRAELQPGAEIAVQGDTAAVRALIEATRLGGSPSS